MAAFIACAGRAASTPTLQLIATQRNVSASAWDLPACTPPADVESSSAAGPFAGAAEAGPACADLGALIGAWQTSDVGADGLVATGQASCTWGAVPDWHSASTSAASTTTVTFTIAEPTRILVSGLLWMDYVMDIDGFASTQFGASLALQRWTGTALEDILTSDDGPINLFSPFAASAVLQPGLHVLSLSASSAVTLQGATELIDVEAGFDVAFSTADMADLDGSGVVDGADVGLLLAAWGPCSGCSPFKCPADITDDCVIDGADLGALLTAWGTSGS